MALISKLTAIGDAIRAKTGGNTPLTLDEMVVEIQGIQTGGTVESLEVTANGTYTAPEGIDGYNPVIVNVPQDGGPPEEAFVISGDSEYRFANNAWNWFIETYGTQITTKNIGHVEYMFAESHELTSIPFDLNFVGSFNMADYLFNGCSNLKAIPKMNSFKVYSMYRMFAGCSLIRNLPEDFNVSWDYVNSASSSTVGRAHYLCYNCHSLRTFPSALFANHTKSISNSYTYFSYGFASCYALDELVDLPIINGTWTGNGFTSFVNSCGRLKNLTFYLPDGQPYVKQWKAQTIDLSSFVGHASQRAHILSYNSGITADKEVKDDATYQALKNDPDWFTLKVEYSRYNHDSAVNTINSLPDTSAYLATQSSGTNTIKFKGAAGSATDGGAINTLTEEEIAVATAKGWTISFV